MRTKRPFGNMVGFVKLCREFSSSKFAQDFGGNVSAKLDGKRMAIKASGVRLGGVGAGRGFSVVDWGMIASAYSQNKDADEKSAGETIASSVLGGEAHPSMEAGFHSFLGTYVLHLHPVHINAVACLKGGRRALESIFGNGKFIWCGYARPGHELALAVKKAVGGKKECVVFLENHGMIVSSSSAEKCASTARAVEKRAEMFIAKKLGRRALFSLEKCRRWKEGREGKFLFPDAAVFSGAGTVGAKETMAANAYLIRVSKMLGNPRYLAKREIRELRGMEAEKRRQAKAGI